MNKDEKKYTRILSSLSEEFIINLDDIRSLFREEKIRTNFRALNQGIFSINSIFKNPPKLMSLNYISDVSTKVSRNRTLLDNAIPSDDSEFFDQDMFFFENLQPKELKRIKDDSGVVTKTLVNNTSFNESRKTYGDNKGPLLKFY